MKTIIFSLMLLIPNITMASEKPVSYAISQWYWLNSECRGSSGDDPETDLWCNLRDRMGDYIQEQGFCFEGESMADSEWKICSK